MSQSKKKSIRKNCQSHRHVTSSSNPSRMITRSVTRSKLLMKKLNLGKRSNMTKVPKCKKVITSKLGMCKLNIGSRAQVHHGTAFKTSGGLCKQDLIKNVRGRIVSRKKYMKGKRFNQLAASGYKTTSGQFGWTYCKPNVTKSRRLRK